MMPSPIEAAALARCHTLFKAWVNHYAGSPQIHSTTPDLRSFQAGYLTALMEIQEGMADTKKKMTEEKEHITKLEETNKRQKKAAIWVFIGWILCILAAALLDWLAAAIREWNK